MPRPSLTSSGEDLIPDADFLFVYASGYEDAGFLGLRIVWGVRECRQYRQHLEGTSRPRDGFDAHHLRVSSGTEDGEWHISVVALSRRTRKAVGYIRFSLAAATDAEEFYELSSPRPARARRRNPAYWPMRLEIAVDAVYVKPSYRRRGVGRSLAAAVALLAEHAFLSLVERAHAAPLPAWIKPYMSGDIESEGGSAVLRLIRDKLKRFGEDMRDGVYDDHPMVAEALCSPSEGLVQVLDVEYDVGW